jgi:hypothetical protein
MSPLSSRVLRVGVAGVAALVLAAPAGARILPVDDADGSFAVRPAPRTVATVARKQSSTGLAQYGWGAAATFAKQQTRVAFASRARNESFAQFGWGAAGTYAKLHA